MEKEQYKMKTKDLILAGAFIALYIAVMMMVVMTVGFVPIVYIFAPFILSVLLGPVYSLYVAKVPKFGALLVLGIVVTLFSNMIAVWFAYVWGIAITIAVELIARAGKYQSKKMYTLSYVVFALTNMGPFWTLVLSRETFLESTVAYYGEAYAQTMDALTPSWIVFAFVGMALVGGFLGAKFGQKVMKKHFDKVGIN